MVVLSGLVEEVVAAVVVFSLIVRIMR